MLRYLALFGLVLTAGCNGTEAEVNLADVYGTVTLDGKPLEGVSLSFQPQPSGRPGSAKTDSSGNYKVYFSTSASGAPVGTHQVKVTKLEFPEDDPDAEGVEIVPEKYRALEFEVKDGTDNEFNIEMTSP